MKVERLFLVVPWGCLRFVIVAFPDHTHLLFLMEANVTLFVMSCGDVMYVTSQEKLCTETAAGICLPYK